MFKIEENIMVLQFFNYCTVKFTKVLHSISVNSIQAGKIVKRMKAKEVLRQYEAGERDFHGLNLRGQSFKGANLSGADFRNTKLHSAKFTNAILTGVNFTGAECGLQMRWAAYLFLCILWLIVLLELGSLICVDTIVSILNFDNRIFLILFTAGTFFSIFQVIKKISKALASEEIFTGQILVVLAAAGAGTFMMILIAGLSESISSESILQIEALKLALVGTLLGIILIGIAAITAIALLTGVLGVTEIIIIEIMILALIYSWKGIPALLISFAAKLAANYAGWNSIKDNGTQSWIRSFAISTLVSQGTGFYGADLTEAIFTKAKLKGAYFTKATLTRAYWKDAKMIDMAKFGETYLRNASLRQLLISGDGKEKNFDRQDLRGVNLKDANLTDASFIDTDLSQANLQKTTLLRTKLVQTNLDKADLRNADLTGAYIEDWGITRNTRFEGVKGDYVYQKLPTEDNRDPNRMPPSNLNPKKDKFGENDLYIFITSVLDTLDLYHRQNINAGVAIAVLKGLTEDYPVKFELVGIEKRGDNQYVMKLKVFGQASHFQLKREYYDRYEQTLILDDPNQKLIPDNEKLFAKIIKTVEENPGIHIEHLHNKGIFITGGKFVDMSRKVEVNNGNYNEEIKGNIYDTKNAGIVHNEGEIKGNAKVAGVINEVAQKNLANAAKEIQQILEQLSKTYPTTTSKDKNIVVGEAVDRIENNPQLKTRVINALKAGGIEAFKEAINHPLVNILVATIEGWQDTEENNPAKEKILNDFRQAWQEAKNGKTIPVEQLWED